MLSVVICEKHMGVRIVAQPIACGEDEQSMANECDCECHTNTARYHAGFCSVSGIAIRLGLRRFSRA